MTLTEDSFLRYVGHDGVWRIWDGGGLLEGEWLKIAGHSVSVAAATWAVMGFLKEVEEIVVPLATFGALMHDTLRRRGIEATKREYVSKAAVAAVVNQDDFLSDYG